MYYFWVTGGCLSGKRWADLACASSQSGQIFGEQGVLWPFPSLCPGTREGRCGADGQPQAVCFVQYCYNILFLCMFLLFKKAFVPQCGEIPGSSGSRHVHIFVTILILLCFLEIFLVCTLLWVRLAGWYGQTAPYPQPLPLPRVRQKCRFLAGYCGEAGG